MLFFSLFIATWLLHDVIVKFKSEALIYVAFQISLKLIIKKYNTKQITT